MEFATRTKSLLAVACLSAGVAFAPHALAQETTTQSPPESSAQTADVSDEKLQSFVVAFMEIEKVKQDYAQQLQSAESEDQQQKLRNEAGQEMLQAVENTDGMTVDEYNQIMRSAQNDPDLAQKLSQAIQQAQ